MTESGVICYCAGLAYTEHIGLQLIRAIEVAA